MKENKDYRRQQLIKATIKTIALYGLSNTTIAKVTKQAKLSAGIVSFYFDSKEKLLIGTLETLSEEFKLVIDSALAGESEPEKKLTALISAYFDPTLCDIDKIAVWIAFCSESNARQEYMKICGEQDKWLRLSIEKIIHEILENHGKDTSSANIIARGLEGIVEGLWQDYLFAPDKFDPNNAKALCGDYLQVIFPDIKTSVASKSNSNNCEHSNSLTLERLPVWTYNDNEFLELEKQELFRKNWLIAGHISDLKNPRDFITLDAVDERAIIIRGNDNEIRAFHNVCRHRGAKLKDVRSGKCAHALTCPFHGWTYRLEGDLIGVPDEKSFDNLNKADHGLIPLDFEIWMGFVFVRFNSDGPSLAETMKPVESLIAPYQIENMVPVKGSAFHDVRPYNWKVVHDIDNEGYHVPVGHPSLQELYGKTYTDTTKEGISVSYGYVNEKPARSWSVRNYQKLLPNFPHLPEDNQKLWLYIGVYPSMVIGLYPDSIEYYMTLPLNTRSTVYRGGSYALEDSRNGIEAVRYLNRRINIETEQEDESFVSWLQEGMLSSAFPTPILSSRESGVRAFHNAIQDSLPVAQLKNHPGAGMIKKINQTMTSAL